LSRPWDALASDLSVRRALDRITCVPGAPVEGGLRGATHTDPGLPGLCGGLVVEPQGRTTRPALSVFHSPLAESSHRHCRTVRRKTWRIDIRVVVSRRASSPLCEPSGAAERSRRRGGLWRGATRAVSPGRSGWRPGRKGGRLSQQCPICGLARIELLDVNAVQVLLEQRPSGRRL